MDALIDLLPPHLYSFLLICAHNSLRAAHSLYSIARTCISTHPTQWDTYAILPPLITLFAAYLALASLYRTARWTVSVMFFFVKWGTILGILFAGLGYVANYAPEAQCDTSRPNSKECRASQRRQQATRGTAGNKPKSWESYQKHQEWEQRQREQANAKDALSNTLAFALKAADLAFDQQEWWGSLRRTIVGDGGDKGKEQGRKDRAGRSRSR